MTGAQQQGPSVFSARKVDGVRSYRRARRGETVTLAASDITVHEIELVSYAAPSLTFRTRVSAGTYVRAMARDLGAALETGAHLTALRREAIGNLKVTQATPLEAFNADTPLVPLQQVLAHLPAVQVTDEERVAIGHGRSIGRISSGMSHVLLMHGETLLAVAKEDAEWLRPVVVLEGA
jgi:tRNA pseudouridine55 synthase